MPQTVDVTELVGKAPFGRFQFGITALCAHGGLTGVPQVNLPGATVDGLPVGLSIIAARSSDAMLVAVAKAMTAQGG